MGTAGVKDALTPVNVVSQPHFDEATKVPDEALYSRL